MIVSYYSIFLQKSILWLRCMYYSDESSRVKQGRGEGWLHKICTDRTAHFCMAFLFMAAFVFAPLCGHQFRCFMRNHPFVLLFL